MSWLRDNLPKYLWKEIFPGCGCLIFLCLLFPFACLSPFQKVSGLVVCESDEVLVSESHEVFNDPDHNKNSTFHQCCVKKARLGTRKNLCGNGYDFDAVKAYLPPLLGALGLGFGLALAITLGIRKKVLGK